MLGRCPMEDIWFEVEMLNAHIDDHIGTQVPQSPLSNSYDQTHTRTHAHGRTRTHTHTHARTHTHTHSIKIHSSLKMCCPHSRCTNSTSLHTAPTYHCTQRQAQGNYCGAEDTTSVHPYQVNTATFDRLSSLYSFPLANSVPNTSAVPESS